MSITKKYTLRTKPIEAVYLTENNVDEVVEWCSGRHLADIDGRAAIKVDVLSTYGTNERSLIPTTVVAGKHVIFKNSQGYFVVLTVKRFEEIWEPVDSSDERPLDTVVDN